jgi:hypothetical protein
VRNVHVNKKTAITWSFCRRYDILFGWFLVEDISLCFLALGVLRFSPKIRM